MLRLQRLQRLLAATDADAAGPSEIYHTHASCALDYSHLLAYCTLPDCVQPPRWGRRTHARQQNMTVHNARAARNQSARRASNSQQRTQRNNIANKKWFIRGRSASRRPDAFIKTIKMRITHSHHQRNSGSSNRPILDDFPQLVEMETAARSPSSRANKCVVVLFVFRFCITFLFIGFSRHSISAHAYNINITQ